MTTRTLQHEHRFSGQSASSTSSRRETSGSPAGLNPHLVFCAGMLGLAGCTWLAFERGISTIPEAVIFSLVSGASFGAFANVFTGSAKFVFGKMFCATSMLAVLMFIIVLLFQSFHLIEINGATLASSNTGERITSIGVDGRRDFAINRITPDVPCQTPAKASNAG